MAVLSDEINSTGWVSLVGAGPGDPDLLTVKALRLIQQAKVVVYDRLVSQEIMALINPAAELIYVGKKESFHCVPQNKINHILVELAQLGQHVIRLKGGDPFMFGRGGEEVEALVASGIKYEIVPGITAATACTSYAGIPLTHRDHAQSVQFVTGHVQPNGKEHDWAALARSNNTLVFYMGLKQSAYIAEKLMEYKLDSNTSCAVIEKGTMAEQRVLVGPLLDLSKMTAQVQSPALIVIGSVTSLHEKLAWF